MNKTVFIIDDDPLLRLIVEKMMGKVYSPLVVIHCENGKVGLNKLKDHLEASSKCIILLDLNMPVLDGWGFLDEIDSSQLSAYQNITLYILSSSIDKSDIERAKQYSCVKKFYHKPLNSNNIIEILNSN
ncbi:response regulator [Algoriphagus sp. D3-2-R+10]|uniref:response regulator n=1 Tax=Algoriphagus aurantiacus TaxID=3103948 RepID=UPI002B3CE95C|nr:response regulator [Algoriphagus sp. D3-2-R+10]MEB2778297.1 response regulator [Algoriphagus sp. D3-2-R+10]